MIYLLLYCLQKLAANILNIIAKTQSCIDMYVNVSSYEASSVWMFLRTLKAILQA